MFGSSHFSPGFCCGPYLLICLHVGLYLLLNIFRGDLKIQWLQHPYSAASCSQCIWGKLYIALACCSILAAAFWLQPAVTNFDVFPYARRITAIRTTSGSVLCFRTTLQAWISSALLTEKPL